MYEIHQTDVFQLWLDELRDKRVRARVLARVRHAGLGNFGDHASVGGGVSEMRIHLGPGYRLYFTIRKKALVFMLVGGDKSTQARDIARAQDMSRKLE